MKRDLLRKSLSLGLLRCVGAGLGIAGTAIIGRALGPAGLGTYAYFLAALAMLSIPVTQGWATLLLRQAAAARTENSWEEVRGLLIRGLHYTVGWTFLAVILVLVSRIIAKDQLSVPSVILALLLGLIIFFDQVSILRMALLRALDQPGFAQLPETTIKPLILLGVFGMLVVMLRGRVEVVHALAALAIAGAISASAGNFLLKRVQPIDINSATPRFHDRAWILTSVTLGLSYGIALINAYVDLLTLGIFNPLSDVGYYRVAITLSLLSAMPWQVLNMIGGERFALFHSAGKKAEMQATATFLARLTFYATVPVVLFLAFWGKSVIGFVFGVKFVNAYLPTLVLSSLFVINAFFGMPRTLLVMVGKERLVLRASIWTLGLNLGLCLALIPSMGMLGAAIANVAATGFWTIRLCFQCRRLTLVDTSIVGWAKDNHRDSPQRNK